METAFPNDNRADRFGSNLLPLHWAITAQNELTIDDLTKTMTKEIFSASTYKPPKQILGHLLASSKSPNVDFAVHLSTMLPRIFRVKDSHNNYPLHKAACYSNNKAFVEYIMQQNPEAIQAAGFNNRPPLHYSARNVNENRYEIFAILLDAYPEALATTDSAGNTVLHYAVESDNPCVEIIQTIIAGRPQLCQAVDSVGSLPIHIYVSRRFQPQMAILRILVESYRDGLSVADNQGDLPAGLAA
jgi:hypothetical protein